MSTNHFIGVEPIDSCIVHLHINLKLLKCFIHVKKTEKGKNPGHYYVEFIEILKFINGLVHKAKAHWALWASGPYGLYGLPGPCRHKPMELLGLQALMGLSWAVLPKLRTLPVGETWEVKYMGLIFVCINVFSRTSTRDLKITRKQQSYCYDIKCTSFSEV